MSNERRCVHVVISVHLISVTSRSGRLQRALPGRLDRTESAVVGLKCVCVQSDGREAIGRIRADLPGGLRTSRRSVFEGKILGKNRRSPKTGGEVACVEYKTNRMIEIAN